MQKGAFLGEMADSGIHAEYENIIEGYDFTGVKCIPQCEAKRTCICGNYGIPPVWLVS